MQAFIVELPNRPGSLAAVCKALGASGINMIGAAGATAGEIGSLAFTADDDAGARTVLEAGGWTYRQVEVVQAALEHRPGSLGDAARRMADAGVNLETLFATGMQGDKVLIAFGVSDVAAARAALGDSAVG
jgi:hypothetical protein